MTQQWPQPPYGINDQSGNAYRSAPTLVKLAAIFNFVMAGIDCFYGIGMIVGAIAFLVVPDTSGDPDAPPHWIFTMIMGVVAVFALVAALLKFIAAMKLIRFGNGARGWGLTAGIFGCTQLCCIYGYILPLACGVFTIIVVCQESVRAYLRDSRLARLQNAAP